MTKKAITIFNILLNMHGLIAACCLLLSAVAKPVLFGSWGSGKQETDTKYLDSCICDPSFKGSMTDPLKPKSSLIRFACCFSGVEPTDAQLDQTTHGMGTSLKSNLLSINSDSAETAELSTKTVQMTVDIPITSQYKFIRQLPKELPEEHNTRPNLLPRTKRVQQHTLLVDLDGTLVHCGNEKPEKFDFQIRSMKQKIFCVLRPGWNDFLNEAASMFEVVIWSAGSYEYVIDVVEKLEALLPKGVITYILTRLDTLPVHGNYVKEMSVLGRHPAQVIALDDNIAAFGYNVDNVILIKTFNGDKDDRQLIRTLDILRDLQYSRDVRDNLKRNFGYGFKIYGNAPYKAPRYRGPWPN
jgi:Dullard-like phosphatase family protein